MTLALRQFSIADLVGYLIAGRTDSALDLPGELMENAWTVDATGLAKALPSRVTLKSSGSTGVPRSMTWNIDALVLDAEIVAMELGASPGMPILSYAPPTHAFGLNCGLLLADHLGARFTYAPLLTSPSSLYDAVEEIGLIVTIPSTWSVLSRDSEFFRKAGHIRILHSAGPIPEKGRTLLQQIGPAEVLEVFGSSETGAIATRRQARSNHAAWTLTPQQPDLVPMADRLSPWRYAGDDRTPTETGDRIRRIGPRRFEFLGRDANLIKVNGVNVPLEEIEACISKIRPDLDVAVSKHPDNLRGQGYVLAVASPLIKPDTAQTIRRIIIDEIRCRFGREALPQKLIIRSGLRQLPSGKLSV